MFHCKRVLSDGEAVDCPWVIYWASKTKSVVITAKRLALGVQLHYTKYLISEGIECNNSCIYLVLRHCPLKSMLERWNWGHVPDLPFTSTISIVMTCASLKKFCTRHWLGPRKSASNRARHLLRPALCWTTSPPNTVISAKMVRTNDQNDPGKIGESSPAGYPDGKTSHKTRCLDYISYLTGSCFVVEPAEL